MIIGMMETVVPLEALENRLPAFAKDAKLNLSSMLTDESLPVQQRYGTFLACAVATRNVDVIRAFESLAASTSPRRRSMRPVLLRR